MKSPKNRLLEHLSGRPPQYHMFSFKAFTWCRTPKTEHRVPSSVNTPHVSLNLSTLLYKSQLFFSGTRGFDSCLHKMEIPKNRLLEHLSGKPPQYHMFSFKAFKWCRTPKTEHRVPSSVNTPHVSLSLSQLSFINPSFFSLEPEALILVSTKWKSCINSCSRTLCSI